MASDPGGGAFGGFDAIKKDILSGPAPDEDEQQQPMQPQPG